MNKEKFWNIFRYACESGLMRCSECPLEKENIHEPCPVLEKDYEAFLEWLESGE